MKRAFYIVISVAFLVSAGCASGAGQVPATPSATLPPVVPPTDIPTLDVGTPIPPPVEAPAVEKPQLTSLRMVNETDGWGITESAILRTNDGGITWHNVTPSGQALLGYNVGSFYLDASRALMLEASQADPFGSGTLYKTEDGGQTWTSVQVPFGAAQMRFLDMQKGWAMASLGVAAGSNAISIFQTQDGGQTWDKVFSNDPAAAQPNVQIPLGGLKGPFFPLDMQTAWVGGVIYSPGTVYLFRTQDGGHSWSPVDLALPEGAQDSELSIEDIQFVTATTGFLSMQVTGQQLSRAIYRTQDAGETWELLPNLIPNARAVDFVSQTDGFVFDGQGFQVTHDAGQTWQAVESDTSFGDSFMRMDFVNSTTGWVTASDPATFAATLYKTTDGGRTWIQQ